MKKIIWIILFAIIGLLMAREFASAQTLNTLYQFTNESGTASDYNFQNRVYDPDGSYLWHTFTSDKNGLVKEIDFRLKRHTAITYDLYFTTPEGEEYIPYTSVSTTYATTTKVLEKPFIIKKGETFSILMYVKTDPTLGRYYTARAQLNSVYNTSTLSRYVPTIGIVTIDGYIRSVYRGYEYVLRPEWLQALIPTAFATTTCEFVSSGATTTASCADATLKISDDPTRNVFFGYILFVISFAGFFVLWDKFRKKGGD